MFAALEKVCLIESRDTCNYSRCGRTDKGVSARGQVIALHLRSNLISGVEFADEVSASTSSDSTTIGKDAKEREEITYDVILNRVLPPTIRVLSWSPVKKDFSARFSCLSRVYRYFFCGYNLAIDKMKEAASYLVGEHDYRNFCKVCLYIYIYICYI